MNLPQSHILLISCICMYVYICMCVCIDYMCMYVQNVYICSYLFVCACIACICMYLCWHLQTPVCVCICMCVHVSTCICLYYIYEHVSACIGMYLTVYQRSDCPPKKLFPPKICSSWRLQGVNFESKRKNKMPLTKLGFEHLCPESYESVSPTEPQWLHTEMFKYGVIIASNRDTDTYRHIHTHTYIYTYIYAYNTYVFVYVCICMYLPVSACITSMCMYLHVLVCIYLYMYVFTCMCLYAYPGGGSRLTKICSSWRLQGVNFESKRKLMPE
jgi:hypothetical protein